MVFKNMRELAMAIEKMLGIKGVLDEKKKCVEFYSPTNILMFKVMMTEFDNNSWKFGGFSTLFPQDWKAFTKLKAV